MKIEIELFRPEEKLPEKGGEYLIITSSSSLIVPYSTKFKAFNVSDNYHEDDRTKISCTYWGELPELDDSGQESLKELSAKAQEMGTYERCTPEEQKAFEAMMEKELEHGDPYADMMRGWSKQIAKQQERREFIKQYFYHAYQGYCANPNVDYMFPMKITIECGLGLWQEFDKQLTEIEKGERE